MIKCLKKGFSLTRATLRTRVCMKKAIAYQQLSKWRKNYAYD